MVEEESESDGEIAELRAEIASLRERLSGMEQLEEEYYELRVYFVSLRHTSLHMLKDLRKCVDGNGSITSQVGKGKGL